MLSTDAPEIRIGHLAAYFGYRDRLIRGLSGTVLEIGAGTGANLALLPAGVHWIGLEPDRRRRAHLAEAAARYGHRDPVLPGRAEDLPLPAGSVDAVLSTITLCSVADQDRCLQQIHKVLRPGGRFVFAEHIAAPAGTWSYRAQRLIAPLSRRFDHGCDPSRRTDSALERAGFDRLELRRFRGDGRFLQAFIAGYAQI